MLLISLALALDCTDTSAWPDPVLCAAVNQAVTDGNDVYGATVLADTAPWARRPSTVYQRLATLRDLGAAEGCTLDPTVQGVAVAAWNAGSWSGLWANVDGSDGAHAGTSAARRVLGGFSGDEAGDVGDRYGVYNDGGRVAANREDGFVVGHWVRVQGKRGVFVGLQGICDGAASAPEAFDDWYGDGVLHCIEIGDADGDGLCTDVDRCDHWADPDGACTWLVDDDASGVGDGTTWDDAFPTIAGALGVASDGDAVWVAAGSYVQGTSLLLPDDVALYGGFDGTESALVDRREWFASTVITADANGDDVPFDLPSRADNLNAPLVYSGNGAVLDGFRISGGKSTSLWGAALRTRSGDTLTARNLRLEDNVTPNRAIVHVGTGTGLHLSDSLIVGNQSTVDLVARFEPGQTGSSWVNVGVADNRGVGDLLVWIDDGPVLVSGCSFDASDVARVLGFGSVASGDFHVDNTVMWGSTGNSVISFGGPLAIGTTCAEGTLAPWGSGNLDLDGSTAATGDPFERSPSGERWLSPASVCVDAGDDGVADADLPDWADQTTASDQTLDTPPVDLGAHRRPHGPRVATLENVGGTLVWATEDTTSCTLDGVAVATSGSSPVTGAWHALECVGAIGDTRAVYTCDGDVGSGDSDRDGVCDA